MGPERTLERILGLITSFVKHVTNFVGILRVMPGEKGRKVRSNLYFVEEPFVGLKRIRREVARKGKARHGGYPRFLFVKGVLQSRFFNGLDTAVRSSVH